jgi:hypothetical protein
MVPDASDLLALPAVALSYALVRRLETHARHHHPSPAAQLGATAIAIVLSTATSESCMEWVHNYPHWAPLADTTGVVGCTDAKWWVSKSGKEGVEITLRLHGRSEGTCTVRLEHALFVIADVRVSAGVKLPIEASVAGGQDVFLYLPFLFENNKQWNLGKRAGELELALSSGEASTAMTQTRVQMEHRFEGHSVARVRTDVGHCRQWHGTPDAGQ